MNAIDAMKQAGNAFALMGEDLNGVLIIGGTSPFIQETTLAVRNAIKSLHEAIAREEAQPKSFAKLYADNTDGIEAERLAMIEEAQTVEPVIKQSLSTEREVLIADLRILEGEQMLSTHAAWICAAADMLAADAPKVQHSDNISVDRFAGAMKAKLASARAKGRSGWDNPEACTAEYLSELLHGHVAKGDPVDVANFCMMLEAREARITPESAQQVAVPQRWVEALARELCLWDQEDPDAVLDYRPTGDILTWHRQDVKAGKLIAAMIAAAPQPPQAERVPMTDEEADLLCEKALFCKISKQHLLRAVEAHHGIGVKP